MADPVTFDGANRLIVCNAGVTELEVERDLYSAWKRWTAADVANSKWPQAMRSVGGDSLSETKDLGATFFLLNDWKIRPDEADHWLTVNGNLYTDPSGESPFVATLGSYTVTISMVVSNLSDASLAQMPEIEYASFNGGVTVDTVNGTAGTAYPIGTPSSPVDNMPNALAIAVSRGFKKFYIVGEVYVTSGDFSAGYTFDGITPMTSNIIINGTADVEGCEFLNAPVSGYFDDNTVMRNCLAISLYDYDAFIHQTGLIGTIYLAPGAQLQVWDSWDATQSETAEDAPALDFGSGAEAAVRNYSGALRVENMEHADDLLIVESNHGHLYIDSSCTAGTIRIHSCDVVVDESAGTEVVDERPVHGVCKVLRNKTITDPETGVMTIYEDDGVTPFISADIFEDADGTTPYQGEGVDRRERLA